MKSLLILNAIALAVIVIQNRILDKRVQELENKVLEGTKETLENRREIYKTDKEIRSINNKINDIKIKGLLSPRFFKLKQVDCKNDKYEVINL